MIALGMLRPGRCFWYAGKLFTMGGRYFGLCRVTSNGRIFVLSAQCRVQAVGL